MARVGAIVDSAPDRGGVRSCAAWSGRAAREGGRAAHASGNRLLLLVDDEARQGWAFPGEQKPVLIFEALQPAPRYVVLAWRRGLVPLWFSRKPFPHLVVLPARTQWCPNKRG